MHIRTVVLAAFVAAASSAAATARAEEDPRWTIGAGVGTEQLFFVSSGTPGLISAGVTSAPVGTFFLERRVGDRTWLVFTGSGSVSRTRFDPPPVTGGAGLPVPTRQDAEQISGSIGLRRVVTRPGAVVDFSLFATVGGGYAYAQQEDTDSAGAVTKFRDTRGFAEVNGGIAVERTLTGGLAVRISTPLLGASWSRLERNAGTGTRDGSAIETFVAVAPRIELRLAF